MSYSIVLGNGNTRKSVPNDLLKDKNTFACNYAYRDFTPANLIVCDRHMLITALSEGAASKSKVWTRPRWYNNIDPKDNLCPFPELPFAPENKFDAPMNWGSGTYAAYLACLDEPSVLVFVGFDLWGEQGKVNNIYAGLDGYGPSDAAPVDPRGWIYQFQKLFSYYPEKQFVFLNWPSWQEPKEWKQHSNFFRDNLKALNSL